MINLEQEFNVRINELSKKILDYPFDNKMMYCRWLNQQFYLIQNTTRYLALSASKVNVNEPKVFEEWAHHLDEEMNHDLFITRDLKFMGYTEYEPMKPITRAIIATQYHDIEQYGPNGLLGYAHLLEGISCIICAPIADLVEKKYGKRSGTYLRLHASVDIEHFADGKEKIYSLPQEEAEVVFKNLDTMFPLYCTMLDELLADYDKYKTAESTQSRMVQTL